MLAVLPITDALRTAAKELGQAAYLARQINLAARTLYEFFVWRANERGFCWWGLRALCAHFQRCDRQVRRWIKQLVDAGLIQRVYHPNDEADTYITAYLAPQPAQRSLFDAAESDPTGTQMSDPSLKETAESGGGNAPASAPASAEPPNPPQTEQPTPKRIDHQSCDSSAPAAPLDPAVSEKLALLRSGGVANPRVCEELAQTQPLEVIRRTVQTALASGGRIGGGAVVDALRQGYVLCLRPQRRSQRTDRRGSPLSARPIPPQPDPAQILAGRAERLAANRRELEEVGLGPA